MHNRLFTGQKVIIHFWVNALKVLCFLNLDKDMCCILEKMSIFAPYINARRYILTCVLAVTAATMWAHGDDALTKTYYYRRNYAQTVRGVYSIYMSYNVNTKRRNAMLPLVPTMYHIARGSHERYGETYGQIEFQTLDDYSITRQHTTGDIPSYRKALPIMIKYAIPDIYGVSLFGGNMLSPFNPENRKFYIITADSIEGEAGHTAITFEPRIDNTQLVSGSAVIEKATGRVLSCSFNGEYDMITFHTVIDMGEDGHDNSIIPQKSTTTAKFKFLGNDIEATYYIDYHTDFPTDSIIETQKDTVKAKRTVAQKAWDIFGDNMLNSIKTKTEHASLKLSPILNPLYLSYSHSKGISYKMKLTARYDPAHNSSITFKPQVGYNFKIKKIFYEAPLRYTFDIRHNRWIEVTWKNGNRITNSSVLETIKNESRDTVNFNALNLDYFNDNLMTLTAGTDITKRIALTAGVEYHTRTAVNASYMEEAGKPSRYRSFAPQIALSVTPFTRDLIITASYERAIKNILHSNMEYEKYELDATYNKHLKGLRQLNMRAGYGFYTNQSTSYFVDFDNFKESYIPDEVDDWSGQFQLLNSNWYNASKYYIRANITYVSPLLALSWAPFIGRYVENERLYLSALSIDHTRPYFEIGYGLTNRYFSIGIFGSFLNGEPNEIGCKFTFELFRNW